MTDEFAGVFRPGEQFKVDTPGNRVALVFANVNDGVPMPVAIRCGGAHGILRFAGSTRVELSDQTALFGHVREAFQGVQLSNTILMSGGTRVLGDDDEVAMTILELPWLLRKWHPTCRTLGSAPRTKETSSLVGDHSTFIPSDQLDGNTIVHPGLDVFWFVQVNASQTTADWSLDVPLYVQLMSMLQTDGAATGLWVWGGGAVTAQEITEALAHGHPCAVVRGSGRIADAVALWKDGSHHVIDDTNRALIERMIAAGTNLSDITVINTPPQTQQWLRRAGLVV